MTEQMDSSNPLTWFYIKDEYAHLFPGLTPVPPEPPPLTTLDRMLQVGKTIGVIQ
jgi:hypothetical protein